jgi:predicted aspartyl protease
LSGSFDVETSELIIVPVRLWKQATSFVFRFAVDTGATTTIADLSSLQLLGYEPTSSTSSTALTTASRSEKVEPFLIERVQALGHEHTNFRVLGFALPRELGVDDLLGLNFFRDRRLVLDFRDGALTLD